ncbi:MAG: CDP-diacylglycerol--glycerol-3-phosphate 3-phosphatidyltransferase [Acidobacteriota bacterium]|nr:MAG: CDP-diacylglycerol--glycerol-3-phosphate 3-phosphatidyltransferase [Acidobacteriota bacterium]
MNLPNSLSITRIFLVPVLLVVLLTGNVPNREVWGLIVFLAAAMTDYLDGYLARKRSQVTTLGKLLDPIADKILISAALVALVDLGPAPAWMVIIIIGREFAVTGLRSIASAEGLTIAASRLGKYKMGAQVACCSFLIAGSRYPDSILLYIGKILLWIAVCLAVVSMFRYFRGSWGQIGESIRVRRQLEQKKELEVLRRQEKQSDALINP